MRHSPVQRHQNRVPEEDSEGNGLLWLLLSGLLFVLVLLPVVG